MKCLTRCDFHEKCAKIFKFARVFGHGLQEKKILHGSSVVLQNLKSLSCACILLQKFSFSLVKNDTRASKTVLEVENGLNLPRSTF